MTNSNYRLHPLGYPDPGSRSRFAMDLLELTREHPGVVDAALVRGRQPGTGRTFVWPFSVEGEEAPADGNPPVADGLPVSDGYFDTMGIDLIAGRDFLPEENRYGAEPVLIVNETLASRHLGPNPIGRRIRIGQDPWLTVVGVVRDSFIGSASGGIGLDQSPVEQMYVSWGVAGYAQAMLLVRPRGEPSTFVPEARALVRRLDPDVPLFGVGSLAAAIEESTWAFPLFGRLLEMFAGTALFLSAIGLYGVVSFSVGERRREMGVRMALGADSARIMRMVFRSGVPQLAIGLSIGLVLSLAFGRSLEALLFGVGVADPAVYGLIVLTLTATGLVATFVPARRAARIDPAGLFRKG